MPSAVAAPLLLQHDARRARAARHGLDPLAAFGVWADQERPLDRAADPFRQERRGVHRNRRHAVDLGQRFPAMQVRVDRDQPVDGGGQRPREIKIQTTPALESVVSLVVV